ncbi:MAG TPA: hypothetical protein VNN13_10875, partial [Methylomirabilota bacterium]|nr:hypothetical protein [Methylomirabilota bacterium]
KEKRDPLAMLLMRDRRPAAGPAPEIKEDPALAKLRDVNLIAKTEVVYEEPGPEKGFFRRVAEKLNPFSSSDDKDKKGEEKKNESAIELLAKREAQKKEASGGFLASLWPFGSKNNKEAARTTEPASNTLISQLDGSLKQKGIDVAASPATLKPPPADLPKENEKPKPQPTMDTVALLSSIDANLEKGGKKAGELPPPPEPAEGFKVAAAQERLAKATQSQAPKDIQTSGILSSIDQKLKAQGVEPSQFEKPPTAEEIKAAQKAKPTSVELEPKLALEKGPLFLNPAEAPAPSVKPSETKEAIRPANQPESSDGALAPPSRVLVKGPIQPQVASATKPAESRKAATTPDDEPKGALEQIRQNIESVGKVLNPFSW